MRRRLWALAMAAAAMGACPGGDASRRPAADQDTSQATSERGDRQGGGSQQAVAGPPAPSALPPRLQDVQQGTSPCERAYQTLVGIAEMASQAPAPRRFEPPPRAWFLERCSKLPAEVQRCLDVTYYMRHAAACRQLRDRIRQDEQLHRKLRALLERAPRARRPPSDRSPPRPSPQQPPSQQERSGE